MTAVFDPTYVSQRDALIPLAAQFADDNVGKKPALREPYAAWAIRWSRCFLSAMDRLAREQGLVS